MSRSVSRDVQKPVVIVSENNQRHYYKTFKPIFHCNAKLLVVGVCVGSCPHVRNLRCRYQHAGI